MSTTVNTVRTPLAIAITLGVSLALGGCAAETADIENDTSQTDEGGSTDAGENAPADDAGSEGFVDKKALVPDWVAAGFPIYPGSVSAASGESGGSTMISFSVPDSDEQTIYDWLVEQYSQNGWEARNLDDDNSGFDATNADGREAYFNVTKATFVMSVSQG